MATVTVTYDDLRTQATQLRNGQRAIEDQLGQMKSQIDNLVGSGSVTPESVQAIPAFQGLDCEGRAEVTSGTAGPSSRPAATAHFLDDAAKEGDHEFLNFLECFHAGGL
ncbi:hypothetical protein [Frigoribacterium sp. R86507]|uniref:hypothetical protein n=1 Tax=Frigoribacterium sp. R86507 TaxID=3093850 RepID=UPI0037C78839